MRKHKGRSEVTASIKKMIRRSEQNSHRPITDVMTEVYFKILSNGRLMVFDREPENEVDSKIKKLQSKNIDLKYFIHCLNAYFYSPKDAIDREIEQITIEI